MCWRINFSVARSLNEAQKTRFLVGLPDLNGNPPHVLSCQKVKALVLDNSRRVPTLFVWPADLDVFGFGFRKVMLDWNVVCFLSFLPWDEYHQWKHKHVKNKWSVLLLPSFHPCHSNPSWVANSNGFLGDGFNSTHVSEWCVLGPFTKIGERTQFEASFFDGVAS